MSQIKISQLPELTSLEDTDVIPSVDNSASATKKVSIQTLKDYVNSDLSTVAKSGSYNDLSNKPTIPTKISQLNNDSGFITNNVNNLTNYTKTSELSEVATSGSYNDLSNKPSIPTFSYDSGSKTLTITG